MSAQVEYVCVSREHFEAGLRKPLGSGHITRYENAWAYCAAGKPDEEHTWHKIGGLPIHEIRHDVAWGNRGGSASGGGDR